MARKADLFQGTLDMLILRVLSRGEHHGWGITNKLEQLHFTRHLNMRLLHYSNHHLMFIRLA